MGQSMVSYRPIQVTLATTGRTASERFACVERKEGGCFVNTQLFITTAGTLLGAIIGAAAALVPEYLRRRGKLHSEMFERVESGLTTSGTTGKRVYNFDIRFFNEKGVATGLRDCKLVFYNNDEILLDNVYPKDAVTTYRADGLTFKSREWLANTLEVDIEELASKRKEDVHRIEAKMREARKVVFEGYYPTGEVFEKEIRRQTNGT